MQDLFPGLDKLSPHSVKCVFVEYSRTQKGYQYYDPTTRRYFTSTNVTFFESTPYFTSTFPMNVQVTIPLPTTVESYVVEGASGASIAPIHPLQLYTRRPREWPSVQTPTNATPMSADLGLPIALRKGE